MQSHEAAVSVFTFPPLGDAVEGVCGRSVGVYQRRQQGSGSRLQHHRHTAERAVTRTHTRGPQSEMNEAFLKKYHTKQAADDDDDDDEDADEDVGPLGLLDSLHLKAPEPSAHWVFICLFPSAAEQTVD